MSEYGTRVISASGGRQIDHKRLVPQLIATLNAADFQYVDTPAQDGWIYRKWLVQIPQAAIGRPYVVFFSIPRSESETYYFGAPGGSGCIYKPGAYIEPPTLYYFALDYVTYGNERYGKRVWGPTGQLLYDSGNKHLNIDQAFTGMNPDMGWSGHESNLVVNSYNSPKGSIPASPALSVDSCELLDYWGNKTEVGEARGRLFYRFTNGNQLQSILCRYEYSLEENVTSNDPFSGFWRSPGINTSAMVIDRYQHDV